MANVSRAGWKRNQTGGEHALLLLLGLVVITAMSSAGCKKSSPASKDSGKSSHAPQIKGVLHLESFVVNLADSEENRFLRVGIDLGLENPLPAKEGKGGEGEVPTARVRDSRKTIAWHCGRTARS